MHQRKGHKKNRACLFWWMQKFQFRWQTMYVALFTSPCFSSKIQFRWLSGRCRTFFCKENRINGRNDKFVNVQPEYKRSFFNTFSNNSLSCHAMLHIIIHLRNDRLHMSAQYIQNSNTCRKGNQSGTCSLNRSQYFRCTSWNSPDLSCNTEQETVKLSTKPSIQLTTCALSTNVKRPGRENENSHTTCPWGTLYFALLYFTSLPPHFHRNHMSFAVGF
jgi:hypothetical protein